MLLLLWQGQLQVNVNAIADSKTERGKKKKSQRKMKSMLEASNVSSQCVVEESSKGLSYRGKMNKEVIQNYFKK